MLSTILIWVALLVAGFLVGAYVAACIRWQPVALATVTLTWLAAIVLVFATSWNIFVPAISVAIGMFFVMYNCIYVNTEPIWVTASVSEFLQSIFMIALAFVCKVLEKLGF